MATDDERWLVAERLRMSDERDAAGFDCLLAEAVRGREFCETPCEECRARLLGELADLIYPSEPKVKCVAEVKVDGEQLEKLVHEAVVEYAGVDREALLALAEELSGNILVVPAVYGTYQSGYVAACQDIARRIREALGVSDD